MKRLKRLILIFCIGLSVPLGYFVFNTYRSLEQEERSELRYFAETLFDEVERELAVLIRKEEDRSIDEYQQGAVSGKNGNSSPLSAPPPYPHIVGYFQNNPDGGFHSPLTVQPGKGISESRKREVNEQLRRANALFNEKRSRDEIFEIQPLAKAPGIRAKDSPPPEAESSFAQKYLKRSVAREQKIHLGKKEKRLEKLTVDQAMNLARQDARVLKQAPALPRPPRKGRNEDAYKSGEFYAESENNESWKPDEEAQVSDTFSSAADIADTDTDEGLTLPPQSLQAEVDPMQSVFIDDQFIFVFRRIAVNNQVFRQGFIIRGDSLLDYLVSTHFQPQPISRFARLELRIMNGEQLRLSKTAGASVNTANFRLERAFPRPFSFLRAAITCQNIPRSTGRRTLNIMIAVLAVIMMAGLFAIYRSAWSVVDLSERRSRFVSSVTHELKTPLTNIRMYIEMLEQGIARTPDREQEYYRILGSESARLSRLISNILEFSKLEKKQLRMDLRPGTFEEVIREVQAVMGEKLARDGFVFEAPPPRTRPFLYDREVMIQVVINLLENSMKFGKDSPVKRIRLEVLQNPEHVCIRVSDTGPGIPRQFLKKIFDDFYRGEGPLIQTTRGTGIGLAFVKKVVLAMGGKVSAVNNEEAGCAITLQLPAKA